MIRNRSDWGRLITLAYVALIALAWDATRSAQAGTWPENTSPETSISVPAPSASPTERVRFETSGYRVPAASFPIRMVHLGAPPAGMTQAQVDAAARRATDAWSQTPCAFARMDYAGQRETLAALGPDEVPFEFVAPSGAGCLPPGSIGWTALSCGPNYPTNSVFLNRRDHRWTDQARPFENSGDDAAALIYVELQSVLTHEFGHVLGLLHSEDGRATMAATYRIDGGQRDLSVDDKLGLCALYPAANPADECRSGRDCPAQHSCGRVALQNLDGAAVGPRVALCREPRGGVGDACAPDRLICSQECVYAAQPHDFGYCTVGCEDGGCPADYECTDGLIRPGEAHCRQLPGSKNPGCQITPGSLPSPFALGLAALLSGFYVRAPRLRRPSAT